jgi:hypothetical protein
MAKVHLLFFIVREIKPMPNQLNSDLFSPVSNQAASQTQGGCYYRTYRPVRVIYHQVPVHYSYSGYGGRSINVTNPNIDDGAIVNF